MLIILAIYIIAFDVNNTSYFIITLATIKEAKRP